MIQLTPEAQAKLEFETYPPAPQIEGVWLNPLRKNRSENGWFMEYARFANGTVQNVPSALEVKQISVSFAEANRINAFHIHTKLEQNEIWTVIQGQLMIWLVDLRKGSSTAGVQRKVIRSCPVNSRCSSTFHLGWRTGTRRDSRVRRWCTRWISSSIWRTRTRDGCPGISSGQKCGVITGDEFHF
jgi:dTDP-4-dehydrorhamnose 3,5-epimerase